jgi:carboxylate-amine ligase
MACEPKSATRRPRREEARGSPWDTRTRRGTNAALDRIVTRIRVAAADSGYASEIAGSSNPRHGDTLRCSFDRAETFAIGVEEELLLVDRSHSLSPVAAQLLAFLGDDDRFHPELSPSQIEIVSGTHPDAAGAVADLVRGRRRVIDALNGEARLVGLAAHPICDLLPAVSPGSRYAAIEQRYRWAAHRAGLAAGVHVHLGVPGADRLLAIYNALRGLMPQIAALAAAAPFFAGRDTGLASVRPKLCDALPRQGVGPAFATWDDVADLLAWGARSGAFLDHTELWWECRLHPGFGTIEVRVPDAQSSTGEVEALATVVLCMVRWLAARHDAGQRLPAHGSLAISENRWRATTDGVEGELIDLDRMRLVRARDLLERLLDQISEYARSATEARALERARRRLDWPHPRQQRATVMRGGLEALIAESADLTENVEHAPSPQGVGGRYE